MRRETQNILLVLLGGALLKISLTGTYLRYVKPSHQWLLITGGLVMILLAVVSIVRELRGARDDDGHGHTHSARSAWLLVLPVLAVFLIGPPPLGADSVARASGNTTPSTEGAGSELFPKLPAGDPIALPLSDFSARAAWDSGHSLDNRKARLVGFVVHEGKDTYVARLAIACCAADAFPIKIKLLGKELSNLPNDSWIEVDATLRPGSATRANEYVPSVTTHSVREILAPEDPYEH
ncbi:TIGR03943 family putative permease subunit [Actinophytocola sp.]|uniref:TIGR03943 family putative permease subunit n=1 Tax=Actinophytocola sp. TaxID=1872138 RepID=UPI002ED14A4B